MRALLIGVALGAIGGLTLATLVNANCDSFAEFAAGCSRLRLGVTAFYGALAGGVGVAVWVAVRWLHR